MGLGVSCVFRCDLVVTTGKAVPPLAVFAIVPSVLPRELRYRISSLSASVAATTFPTRILLVVTPRPMGSPLSKSEPGEPGTTFSSPGTSGPIYAESSTPTRSRPLRSTTYPPWPAQCRHGRQYEGHVRWRSSSGVKDARPRQPSSPEPTRAWALVQL